MTNRSKVQSSEVQGFRGSEVQGLASADIISDSVSWCNILGKKLRLEVRDWVKEFTVQRLLYPWY